MKPRLVPTILGSLLAAVLLGLMPQVVEGQDESPSSASLIAQQKTLAENQTVIEVKLAEINEDLRQARIFAARSGRKPTP